jgi:hypothetical protein
MCGPAHDVFVPPVVGSTPVLVASTSPVLASTAGIVVESDPAGPVVVGSDGPSSVPSTAVVPGAPDVAAPDVSAESPGPPSSSLSVADALVACGGTEHATLANIRPKLHPIPHSYFDRIRIAGPPRV